MKKKTKAQLKDIGAEQLNRAKETKRRGKEAVKNTAASEDAYSYMMGGKVKKGYKAGGLKMVEKEGKKVPFYAADGKGQMKAGGKVKEYKAGGKVRGAGCAERGVRAAKMR